MSVVECSEIGTGYCKSSWCKDWEKCHSPVQYLVYNLTDAATYAEGAISGHTMYAIKLINSVHPGFGIRLLYDGTLSAFKTQTNYDGKPYPEMPRFDKDDDNLRLIHELNLNGTPKTEPSPKNTEQKECPMSCINAGACRNYKPRNCRMGFIGTLCRDFIPFGSTHNVGAPKPAKPEPKPDIFELVRELLIKEGYWNSCSSIRTTGPTEAIKYASVVILQDGKEQKGAWDYPFLPYDLHRRGIVIFIPERPNPDFVGEEHNQEKDYIGVTLKGKDGKKVRVMIPKSSAVGKDNKPAHRKKGKAKRKRG